MMIHQRSVALPRLFKRGKPVGLLTDRIGSDSDGHPSKSDLSKVHPHPAGCQAADAQISADGENVIYLFIIAE